MLIKLGSSGPDVKKLIDDLRRLAFALLPGNLFDHTVTTNDRFKGPFGLSRHP